MDVVLRLKKSYRNSAITCLVLFMGMMIGSSYIALANGSILGSLVLGGFWGFWVVLSVMLLLSYYRESLFVDDGKIIQTGVFRRREIALADIVSVRWRIVPVGGSVVLRSSADKIKVTFDNFELEQRRWLIQLFRHSLPQSIQQDWERFCLRNALPLLKQDTDAPLQPDEILITRRRWDRFFLCNYRSNGHRGRRLCLAASKSSAPRFPVGLTRILAVNAILDAGQGSAIQEDVRTGEEVSPILCGLVLHRHGSHDTAWQQPQWSSDWLHDTVVCDCCLSVLSNWSSPRSCQGCSGPSRRRGMGAIDAKG